MRNKGEDTDLLEMQSFINPFKFDNLVIIIPTKTICDDKKLVNYCEAPATLELMNCSNDKKGDPCKGLTLTTTVDREKKRITLKINKEKAINIIESLMEEYDLGTETTEIIKITKRNYTMERRE